MKATGIVRRIDDLGRVVIPKEIRRTMRIREGDPLEIYTTRDGEVIFKKYSLISGLEDFAAQFCDTLSRSTDFTAAVSSTDMTGEQSLPRAKFQSISPFLPRAARSAPGSQLARSPMVRMLRLFSLRFVAGPTNSSSSTGSGHTFCR